MNLSFNKISFEKTTKVKANFYIIDLLGKRSSTFTLNNIWYKIDSIYVKFCSVTVIVDVRFIWSISEGFVCRWIDEFETGARVLIFLIWIDYNCRFLAINGIYMRLVL